MQHIPGAQRTHGHSIRHPSLARSRRRPFFRPPPSPLANPEAYLPRREPTPSTYRLFRLAHDERAGVQRERKLCPSPGLALRLPAARRLSAVVEGAHGLVESMRDCPRSPREATVGIIIRTYEGYLRRSLPDDILELEYTETDDKLPKYEDLSTCVV
jgi:hypothetical protein